MPLAEGARRLALFGSKAVGLGEALRAGPPRPARRRALGRARRGRRRGGRGRDRAGGRRRSRTSAGPLAVRSSAVDEDGADASFAGQHLTLLNVAVGRRPAAALREIWWSANSDSAITYRKRVGLFTRPSVGVVVQSLLDPDAAGVMFTREPDHRRRRAHDRGELGPRRGGRRRPRDPRQLPPRPRRARCSSARPGLKRIAIRGLPDGGTFEEPVSRRSCRRRSASTTRSWPR